MMIAGHRHYLRMEHPQNATIKRLPYHKRVYRRHYRFAKPSLSASIWVMLYIIEWRYINAPCMLDFVEPHDSHSEG